MAKAKRMKRKKKIKFGIIIIRLICICIIVYSGSKIYEWNKYNQDNNKVLSDVKNTIYTVDNNGNIDINSLKNKNSDCVAYLKIKGIDLEYPVVQTTNNSFYLKHSFDKTYNTAGWIFADYRNKIDELNKNLVIYGHNRRDGSMFSKLVNTLSENWYNVSENRKIELYTEKGKNLYEVFSLYKIETEDYYIQTDFFEGEFEKFIDVVKKRSIKDFGVGVEKEDNLLTLSTCDNNNNYRIVIHAKKIEN